ncbi:MAG: LysM peptidoglycan-binding domain-containing protein [Chloroflexota bacterium]
MTRRYLILLITINAIISLAIALLVAWLVELRRPDPEELAALLPALASSTAVATPLLASTAELQQLELRQIETATVAIVPTQSAPQPTGPVYVVQSGDSLSSIATRYGVSLNDLLETNELDDPDFVFVGQRLFLPNGASTDGASSTGTTQSDVGASGVNTSGNSAETTQGTDLSSSVKISGIDGVGDLENESLLLVNESDLPLNLQGWTVSYEGGPIYTFGNFPIFPGGSVRLYTKVGTDTTINVFWGRDTAIWQSQIESRLVNIQGQLVHQYQVP